MSEYTTFPGGVEVVGSSNGSDALRTLPTDLQKLFSEWLVEWIKYKKIQAEQAYALDDKVTYFNILREVAEMPRYQLDDPYEDQYNTINTQMLVKLHDAQSLVSEKQLILDAPVAGRPISVFAQGIPYKYYLPPTEVLLTGYTMDPPGTMAFRKTLIARGD